MGPKRSPNDKVMSVLSTPVLYMAVLERTSFSRDAFWRAAPKYYVLHSGDIVSTYILTDARNVLLLLTITHIRYGMPHDKSKENKVYSRVIFLNSQPNGIPRIIEHVQNATFVHTMRSNVLLTIISQISL